VPDAGLPGSFDLTQLTGIEELAAALDHRAQIIPIDAFRREGEDAEPGTDREAPSPTVRPETREKSPELPRPHPRADHQSPLERPRTLSLHTGKNISRLRSSNLRLIPGLEFAPLRQEDYLRRQSIAPLINEPMPQPEPPRHAQQLDEDVPTASKHSLPPLPSLEESDPAGARLALPGMDRGVHEEPVDEAALPVAEEPPATSHPEAVGDEVEDTGEMEMPRRHAPLLSGFAATQVEPEAKLTPLEELARRLENARIPVVEEYEPRPVFEPSIVSDTLANILVMQGAYAEAIKAFQTLARTKPERFEYYQQKIHEMKWRIQHPDLPWSPHDLDAE
jgi:hypothetical protein